MTVEELQKRLEELVRKHPSAAKMTIDVWNPYEDEDSYNWNGTHNTYGISEIYITDYFNGENWDESNDSYEYVELKLK